MQPSHVIDTIADAELELGPDAELLELAVELAGLERAGWRSRLDALRSSGKPLNAEGDDDDDEDDEDDDDDGDGKKGKKGADDDDDDDDGKKGKKGKKGSKDDDDDDEDDLDLAAARKAAAAANRELRRLRREREEEETKAKKDAGKFKELYEEQKARADKLEADAERGAKERLATAALAAANARNPARAVKLLDLEEVDDEADAERVVKKLLKSDPYLFDKKPSRQKRAAGGSDEDDDDDRDDRRNGGPKPPRNRLRAGLEATTPK